MEEFKRSTVTMVESGQKASRLPKQLRVSEQTLATGAKLRRQGPTSIQLVIEGLILEVR